MADTGGIAEHQRIIAEELKFFACMSANVL